MSRIVTSVCLLLGTAGAIAPPAAGGNPALQSIAPPERVPAPLDTTPMTPGTPVSSSVIPIEVRRAVAADAAQRFRVAPGAVVLTRAERVTWPDASLGCPEPGRVYTQVLVPGFRIVAKTTAGELLYHTDSGGSIVNCARAAAATGR